jgi:hypothetical protein
MPEYELPVSHALSSVTTEEAARPEIVMRHLPPMSATLGPALLFYPPETMSLSTEHLKPATQGEVSAFLACIEPDELDEKRIDFSRQSAIREPTVRRDGRRGVRIR